MDEHEAATLARELMDEFGLENWYLVWDNAKRRFGQTRYRTLTISLSRPLVRLNERGPVEDTIRHEIAHALAGVNAGHGPKWKATCAYTGANPERCYDSDAVETVPHKYVLVCEKCGVEIPRHRRPSRRMLHKADYGMLLVRERAMA